MPRRTTPRRLRAVDPAECPRSRTPRPRSPEEPRGAHGSCAPRSGAARRAAARAAPLPGSPPATARTSSSVMRPPGPVPATVARSTPSSCATRRTTGVACTRPTPARSTMARVPTRHQRRASRRSVRFGRDRIVAAELELARLADDDELRADGRDLAFGDEDPQHGSAVRRRDLHGRLVGLDLDERVVLGDRLALRDEPAGDLALRETLAEVGEPERARHHARLSCAAARRARQRLPRVTSMASAASAMSSGGARNATADT